jgi:hypothetical protein
VQIICGIRSSPGYQRIRRRRYNRYELEFGGYRALGLKANGKARLLSRRGNDFTRRFASIAHALEALPTITVIDGESVAQGADGPPLFASRAIYYFDRARLSSSILGGLGK